jgi:hypothetical protein
MEPFPLPSVPSDENCFDLMGRFIAGSESAAEAFLERVTRRAYFLYTDAAAVHGKDLDHWLLAERQEIQIDSTNRTPPVNYTKTHH